VEKTATRTAAGIGELLWDELPGGRVLGGAPANFAWHAHALGIEGRVISRVGRDEDGAGILGRLAELGLSSDLIETDDSHATGRSTVAVDAAGVPSFRVHDNAAWDFLRKTPALESAAGSVDAVAFGTLAQRNPVSRETILDFVSRTPARAIRLFDLNLRPPHFSRQVIEESLALATVAKLNVTELSVVSDMLRLAGGDEERARTLADEFDLDLVALTLGEKGSVLYSRGRWSVHGGCATPVIDTVGAGDAFAAVLVVGMLEGFDLDRINEYANRAASFVCSRPGATPVLPAQLRVDFIAGS
jgi:fructokinase